MIYVGIDDTDNIDSPGTNQLARKLVARTADRFRCRLIVRHQLLLDPRVPYTSKNSSAALLFDSPADADVDDLIDDLRKGLRELSATGSDPGLCVVTERAPEEVIQFGRRCQQHVVRQQDALGVAAEHQIHLEGLGGTNDGLIGALAAVGLSSTGDDGRVVHIAQWPDDLAGAQCISRLHERRVEVRRIDTNQRITDGIVDVGKHLRPNYRDEKVVLFVEPGDSPESWSSVRLL